MVCIKSLIDEIKKNNKTNRREKLSCIIVLKIILLVKLQNRTIVKLQT